MAESFEVSPDRLTVTLKLRRGPGTKWDDRAPTNGREMDMDDVLFSWKKFAELNPGAANVANSRNPSSPIESLEATDDSTVVLKLARPDATVISLLADTGGGVYLMPKESDGGFDPATTVRGNGPWQLEEHVPSVRFVWRRNPNFYREGRPFPDRLERPIVSEFAQRLAQFRAGNIMTDVVETAQQEVIQLKKDVPQANLWLMQSHSPGLSPSVWFGYEGDSPFKDERVRQAFSMLVDREAYADALLNADVFEAEGLGLESRFNTCITAGWGPYWLDPLSADFGENAKFLQYHPEEAAALLSAAGHPGGVSIDAFFNREGQYGSLYPRAVEVYVGFFTDGGNEINQNPLQYTEFLNNYYFGYRSGASAQGSAGDKQGYNGIAIEAERPYPSAPNLMLGSWHSNGGAFHGLSPNGENAFAGDPSLNAMIERIQGEFNQDTQISLTHDVIRYMTGKTYFIPNPVVRQSYQLWWPAVGNLGMRERWAANNGFWPEQGIDFWIDQKKPPFA
jgi:ABC-type transport system substrate-binding protein